MAETGSLTLHVAAYPEAPGALGVLAHVRIQPPKVEKRFAGDICVIIDVSGSMQMEATMRDQEAGAPVLSILDVVRHAVKATIHTMESTDRICIVSYSDSASKVLDLTFMDDAGKAAAEAALEDLRAGGQTNLWNGLETGLEILRAGERAGATSSALLLTDGVPDEPGPSEGYLSALARYRANRGNKLPCTLHTFGFYELDSALLDGLAQEGDGLYVFIPDAGLLGTALVNCTSNALTAAGRNAKLVIQVEDGVTCQHVFGYSPPGLATECCVPLGSIQLGQNKDLLLRLELSSESDSHTAERPLMSVRFSYDGPDNAAASAGTSEAIVTLSECRMPGDVQVQLLRLQLVETTAVEKICTMVDIVRHAHEKALQEQLLCVCCMDRPCDATFVHGSTAHTTCCMSCASKVQQNFGKCPVCCEPISLVISHAVEVAPLANGQRARRRQQACRLVAQLYEMSLDEARAFCKDMPLQIVLYCEAELYMERPMRPSRRRRRLAWVTAGSQQQAGL